MLVMNDIVKCDDVYAYMASKFFNKPHNECTEINSPNSVVAKFYRMSIKETVIKN